MNCPNLKSNELLNFLDVDLSCYLNSSYSTNSNTKHHLANINTFSSNTNTNNATTNNVNTSPNHLFNSNPNLADYSMRNSPWSPTSAMNENNSSSFSLSMDPLLLLKGVDEDSNNNNNNINTHGGFIDDTSSKTLMANANTFLFNNRMMNTCNLRPVDSTSASLSTTSSISTSTESPSPTSSLLHRQSSYTMPYTTSYNYPLENMKSPKETNNLFMNVTQSDKTNVLGHRSSLPLRLKTSNSALNLTKQSQKSSPIADEEINVFNLSNSDHELSLFSQQDQAYDETLNLSSSLPSTISSYLSHLDNNFLAVENFNIIEPNGISGLPEKNEICLPLQQINSEFLNTSQVTEITTSNVMESSNNNNNSNNNDNNTINKESELFQFDDVNLATPTTENSPMLEQHIQYEQQPKTPIQTDLKMAQNDFLPTSRSLFKSTTNSNSYSKTNQYNSSQIQSFLGSFNQNPTSAAYAAQMNGQMSRSNSQPDLSINVEKLISPNSSLCYNYNNCYPSENNHYIENGFSSINNSNESSFNNQPSGSFNPTTATAKYSAYSNNAQKMKTKNKIRRHPSLSYKNSMSECHEENEDFFSNYLSNNGVINNLSSNDIEINGLNQLFEPNGSTKTQSATNFNSLNTSGVSSMDDGLCLGIDALTDFLSRGGTCSDLFDDLPEIEDLMSLVTFETASSISTGSSVPIFQPIKETQCDINLPSLSNPSAATKYPTNSNQLSSLYDYDEEMDSLMGHNPVSNNTNGVSNDGIDQRTTKSAPPSPTPQRKKQRQTTNLPWNKAW